MPAGDKFPDRSTTFSLVMRCVESATIRKRDPRCRGLRRLSRWPDSARDFILRYPIPTRNFAGRQQRPVS